MFVGDSTWCCERWQHKKQICTQAPDRRRGRRPEVLFRPNVRVLDKKRTYRKFPNLTVLYMRLTYVHVHTHEKSFLLTFALNISNEPEPGRRWDKLTE